MQYFNSPAVWTEGRGGQPLAREHFYPARERGLGNEILPPSNKKVNLQVAILFDETRCLFLHFRLLTICY